MPKPTKTQRHFVTGYAKGSIMDGLSAADRKRIKALMAKDRSDRTHYERGIHHGSEPRRTT